MAEYGGSFKYVPGMYVKKRPGVSDLVDQCFREWEKRKPQADPAQPAPLMPPTICFSRKIGVGALEVADILAKRIGCCVVDREIIQHIAQKANIREKTVSVFDELYPGKMNEFLSLLFGEKSFIKTDYAQHLFRAILAIAYLGLDDFCGQRKSPDFAARPGAGSAIHQQQASSGQPASKSARNQ